MPTKYGLQVYNQSADYEHLCVYQTMPSLAVTNVMSLAWFSKGAHPDTMCTFEWTVDYSFVWGETGMLVPGVTFKAGQHVPADPSSPPLQHVKLTYSEDAYVFERDLDIASPARGALYIVEDDSVPLKQASVGLGMSNSPAVVYQAEPNQVRNFTPKPLYWVTAGDYNQGLVLDVGAITHPQEVRFPPGVFSMTAVLNDRNQWMVVPTQDYSGSSA